MENASKALLIAGSVLIALITIALLIRSFSSISSFQKIQLTEQEQQQIVEFNGQYLKYLNQYVYGTEVASLKNKYESDHQVYIEVIPEEAQLPTGIGQDKQYYKCIKIGYDESIGKVNKLVFERIEINTTHD